MDCDVIIRAYGYDNESILCVSNFTHNNFKIEIEFQSIGDKSITIDSSDDEVIDIAKKYINVEQSITPTEYIEEFEEFEDMFNSESLSNESSFYFYKNLKENDLFEWINDSWIEAYITIKDNNDKIIFQDYESDLVDSQYDSIEQIESLTIDDFECIKEIIK